MKAPCGLVPRLDLMYFFNMVSQRVEVSLTSSTEKVCKHVEGIVVMSLTAFVSLETFLHGIINTCISKPRYQVTHFSMTVVYLSFLEAWNVSKFDLRTECRNIRLGQKGLHKLSRRRFSDLTCKVASIVKGREFIPCATSTNFSSAPGDWFLSGWYFLLSLLYALRISWSVADLDTDKTKRQNNQTVCCVCRIILV